jgi:hypothetical protein
MENEHNLGSINQPITLTKHDILLKPTPQMAYRRQQSAVNVFKVRGWKCENIVINLNFELRQITSKLQDILGAWIYKQTVNYLSDGFKPIFSLPESFHVIVIIPKELQNSVTSSPSNIV